MDMQRLFGASFLTDLKASATEGKIAQRMCCEVDGDADPTLLSQEMMTPARYLFIRW